MFDRYRQASDSDYYRRDDSAEVDVSKIAKLSMNPVLPGRKAPSFAYRFPVNDYAEQSHAQNSR